MAHLTRLEGGFVVQQQTNSTIRIRFSLYICSYCSIRYLLVWVVDVQVMVYAKHIIEVPFDGSENLRHKIRVYSAMNAAW